MRFRNAFVTALAGASLFALAPAMAANADQSVRSANDGEWLSLSGRVLSAEEETFVLDYGKGTIVVEVDDFNWEGEDITVPGDRVTVTGRMDADFWESKKIEAGSVHIDGLNTYYYANAADEEGGYYSTMVTDFVRDDEWLGVSGTVTAVQGRDFVIDTGFDAVTVDTDTMAYDPLDDVGRQRVDVGDRVAVFGEMDDADLFEAREILASSITMIEGGDAAM